MSFTGYDHLTGYYNSEIITADHSHWIKYIYRNFDLALEIILEITTPNIIEENNEKLHCVICGPLSLNYQSIATLSKHYKFNHKFQLVKYFLNNIVSMKPATLKEILDEKHSKFVYESKGGNK
jgi:hypothetical protein